MPGSIERRSGWRTWAAVELVNVAPTPFRSTAKAAVQFAVSCLTVYGKVRHLGAAKIG